MRIILTALTVWLLTTGEAELGQGIVEVDIYKTKEIKLFKNKGDELPEKTIRLVHRDSEIYIEEKDYAKWLKPESVWLDYSIFIFRYTNIEGNWIEVVVNNETMNKKWIQKNETLNVKSWEKFPVENTTAIEPLIPTDIKAEPDANSKTIRKSTNEDCFEAVEVKGDWIRLRTNETLECNEHPTPINSGWIKWRQADELAIIFFLTC
jgi:hypothetical protein